MWPGSSQGLGLDTNVLLAGAPPGQAADPTPGEASSVIEVRARAETLAPSPGAGPRPKKSGSFSNILSSFKKRNSPGCEAGTQPSPPCDR
jgi:hypothetical protein